jgi:hypothetical protein
VAVELGAGDAVRLPSSSFGQNSTATQAIRRTSAKRRRRRLQ